MQVTSTQSGIRNVIVPGGKVWQRLDHLKYHTRLSQDRSIAGYEHLYPMQSKSKATTDLMSFTQDDAGIPLTLVNDNVHEETQGKWGETCCIPHPTKAHCTILPMAEPG